MTFHIVRMNEKIEKIALNYQLDIEEIKAYNKYIKDWNHLIPGTKLRLPEISNALNEELDNYEPFIEEYYPKLSNNYNNISEFDDNVEMVNKEDVVDVNTFNLGKENSKLVNQSLVLPKSNTYYPFQNYYFNYPFNPYYYNRNRKIRK